MKAERRRGIITALERGRKLEQKRKLAELRKLQGKRHWWNFADESMTSSDEESLSGDSSDSSDDSSTLDSQEKPIHSEKTQESVVSDDLKIDKVD